jgi:hypothetical protein
VYYLDWWGDIQPTSPNYPRYIHRGDTLVIGNRIETTGNWHGKAYFEFPIRHERIIIKRASCKKRCKGGFLGVGGYTDLL